MEAAIIMSIILSILCIIFMIVSIVGFVLMIKRMIKLKNTLSDRELERKQLEEENQRKAVAYTKDIMEFIRIMISQVSLLSFQKFKDGHEMTKITETNIKRLIEDIARTVNESIAMENISMGNILITKEFYQKYIIETTVFTIKKMLDEAMIEIEDEL